MKITKPFFRMWRKDASEGGGVWEGPHRLLWGFQELRWIGKSQVKEYLNLRVADFLFKKVSDFYIKKKLWGYKVRLYHHVDLYNNRPM